MLPDGLCRDKALGMLFGAALAASGCATQEVVIPELSGPSEASGSVRVGISTPTPAPAPSPSPDATPSPSPTSPPAASCSLPPGGGSGRDCERVSPLFLGDVTIAIDDVVARRPELFDTSDAKCGNCFRVRDERAFVELLVEAVARRGLCAHYDGEELAVKRTNDLNEQYDVLTADGYLRRGDGSYRSTCRPAWF
jgi:hypothetical protein